jgi:hypothetical protein
MMSAYSFDCVVLGMGFGGPDLRLFLAVREFSPQPSQGKGTYRQGTEQ